MIRKDNFFDFTFDGHDKEIEFNEQAGSIRESLIRSYRKKRTNNLIADNQILALVKCVAEYLNIDNSTDRGRGDNREHIVESFLANPATIAPFLVACYQERDIFNEIELYLGGELQSTSAFSWLLKMVSDCLSSDMQHAAVKSLNERQKMQFGVSMLLLTAEHRKQLLHDNLDEIFALITGKGTNINRVINERGTIFDNLMRVYSFEDYDREEDITKIIQKFSELGTDFFTKHEGLECSSLNLAIEKNPVFAEKIIDNLKLRSYGNIKADPKLLELCKTLLPHAAIGRSNNQGVNLFRMLMGIYRPEELTVNEYESILEKLILKRGKNSLDFNNIKFTIDRLIVGHPEWNNYALFYKNNSLWNLLMNKNASFLGYDDASTIIHCFPVPAATVLETIANQETTSLNLTRLTSLCIRNISNEKKIVMKDKSSSYNKPNVFAFLAKCPQACNMQILEPLSESDGPDYPLDKYNKDIIRNILVTNSFEDEDGPFVLAVKYNNIRFIQLAIVMQCKLSPDLFSRLIYGSQEQKLSELIKASMSEIIRSGKADPADIQQLQAYLQSFYFPPNGFLAHLNGLLQQSNVQANNANSGQITPSYGVKSRSKSKNDDESKDEFVYLNNDGYLPINKAKMS